MATDPVAEAHIDNGSRNDLNNRTDGPVASLADSGNDVGIVGGAANGLAVAGAVIGDRLATSQLQR